MSGVVEAPVDTRPVCGEQECEPPYGGKGACELYDDGRCNVKKLADLECDKA